MSDDELLERLLHEARKSDCAKLKFGAAALQNGRICGLGFNHNPLSDPSWLCATDCVGGIRAGVKSGTCVERCFAVHAEQHALLHAFGSPDEIAVAGLLPDGALFDNGGGFYCTVCARFMVAAGISVVSIWSGGKRKRLSIHEAWAQSYGLLGVKCLPCNPSR